MVRYVLYLLIAFLIIDHVWTHLGPKIINTVASHLAGKEVKAVEEKEEKKSLIDGVIEKLKKTYEEVRHGRL